MSRWERLRAAWQRARAEADDVLTGVEARLDADLDRREADLAAGPEEKLARIRDEIEADADPFDEVRARIERLGRDEPATAPDDGAGSTP